MTFPLSITDHQLTEPADRPSGCGCDGDCSENCACSCHQWRATWTDQDWIENEADLAYQRDLEES